MTDFLLELRSEEIPARMQDGARAELAKLFGAQMVAAGIAADDVTVWSTPRRLALIVRGLPVETAAVSEEYKGPRTSAPAQALEGFLRKTGLTQDQLEDRDGVWFAVVEKPGRATVDVLAEAIPAIVRGVAWPKSMRWGRASTTTESLRWVRPLQGIVAIFGEALVPCEVDGIASGFATRGHRFHHSGEITIGGAHDYAAKLRACHVIVDQDERRAIIRDAALALCAERGLSWIADEALVAENAGLTEWPVPLLGDFDPAFLEVPPEVIRLTLATNQKYFVCANTSPERGGGPRQAPSLASGEAVEKRGGGVASCHDDGGKTPPLHHPPSSASPTASGGAADGPPPRAGEVLDLAPAFICTANIEASDGGAAIVAGNRKVLAARLSDARFFWEQDKKVRLEDHAKKLSRITFHEKLGTVADKVERVAKLARWLVEEGIISPLPFRGGAGGGACQPDTAPADTPHPNPSPEGEGLSKAALADYAETAARLCKADLVTEMVGEFPELQGVMGGYYARAEGLPERLADAIRDHYKPVGQGDDVPTAPVTVAVSLADKLDTIACFFSIDLKPSGSKDPFALRRAAIGVITILLDGQLSVPLSRVLSFALPVMKPQWAAELTDAARKMVDATFEMRARMGDGDVESDRQKIAAKRRDRDSEAIKVDPFSPERLSKAFEIVDFFADRLKVQQREAGVRHDLIDAVFALGGEDDLVRLLARVKALQAFVGTADGVNLLAGYKRAANILKKEGGADARRPGLDPGPLSAERHDESGPGSGAGATFVAEPAEAALIAALDTAEPAAAAAVEGERFEEAMAALATLRAPIDAFFDSVTVNDADPAKRAARLALLARLTAAVGRIADFSKIEG